MANTAKLFHTTVDPEHYLANLEPNAAKLREAKTIVRIWLREAFRVSSATVFGRTITPRFFTQGSVAYKTLNDPAWPPRQQMDLDDGCYLPMSFVRGARPSQAARLFFEFVDGALKKLAEHEGWRHEEKPTCVRLVIALNAHVDVPLYAIPDAEFISLQDARKVAMDSATGKADNWDDLPSDAVLLAHRDEDWIESDPRKIRNWFLDAVDLYGERLRRDCRYLKGWRDHHELDSCRLTSILLMACVWQAYEDIRGPFLKDREDERLLQVVERLPKYLKGVVPNPACKAEDLNRIPAEDRQRICSALEALSANLHDVVSDCHDPRGAVDLLRGAFGNRIPNRPDMVSVVAAAISIVTSAPKRVVAAPEVGRSKSG